MKGKYTPAPWHCVEYAGFMLIQDGEFYGDKDLLNLDKCSLAKENGILAASAPELLEALQSCLYLIDELGVSEGTAITQAESAINKALGINQQNK